MSVKYSFDFLNFQAEGEERKFLRKILVAARSSPLILFTNRWDGSKFGMKNDKVKKGIFFVIISLKLILKIFIKFANLYIIFYR